MPLWCSLHVSSSLGQCSGMLQPADAAQRRQHGCMPAWPATDDVVGLQTRHAKNKNMCNAKANVSSFTCIVLHLPQRLSI